MYNFQYNTRHRDIRIQEYGRHVQNMVDYATTIEDKAERQAVAEEIVDIMINMTDPGNKNSDSLAKAWKHIFFMSENELDVEVPKGVEVSETKELFVHEPMEYPQMDIDFKHYGLNVQKMLKKAQEMENLEDREAYVRIIGSYMKMAYRTWHKEQFVNDEIIKNDIEGMTKGKIKLVLEDTQFNTLKNTVRKTASKPYHNKRSRPTNTNKKNRKRR
ncbi:MAG TPA: DUF4290 domain-containing protein [Membranihabitans sp.]|nr:DUF4290 domain-containing protein [Membranihabitans sp.]